MIGLLIQNITFNLIKRNAHIYLVTFWLFTCPLSSQVLLVKKCAYKHSIMLLVKTCSKQMQSCQLVHILRKWYAFTAYIRKYDFMAVKYAFMKNPVHCVFHSVFGYIFLILQ